MGEKPYEGFTTFLKAKAQGHEDRPLVHVFGVPYDGSNTFRPGTRLGPEAIRSASRFLTDGAHPEFGIDPAPFIVDRNDITVSNADVDKSLRQITSAVLEELTHAAARERNPRALTAFLGGDHTITLPILRAFSKSCGVDPKQLRVVHFDAHCDTWESHFGDPIGHGTWVRNVVDEGVITPENIIQIGIRSPVDPETREWLPSRGGTVISAKQARRMGPDDVVRFIRAVCADAPVYISFDIDCLDPAHAPGTGTPEVGGLASALVLDILDGIVDRNIIGMDVVEVSPPFDHAGITALAAAQILYSVICGRLHNLGVR
jgi:agmatinase